MLKVGNKLIGAPIERILQQIRYETNGEYFKDIIRRGKNLAITCPSHKNHRELHPSCYIYIEDDNQTEYGLAHCFTCDYVASFTKLVGDCFGEDEEFGKEWLCDHFGDVFIEDFEYLPEIDLNEQTPKTRIEDVSILKNYNNYHPYMWSRGLTKEVVDKFVVGYDPKLDAITFPMWDENNNFVGVTARSVKNKFFWIPKELEKPVYLLNVCLFEKHSCIYVCESQIDALVCWGWGLPAVALIGTGTPHQYEVLRKCGIRNFITALDPDDAGRKGTSKLIDALLPTSMITIVDLPSGKDVNDLTKEKFEALELLDLYDWKNKYNIK